MILYLSESIATVLDWPQSSDKNPKEILYDHIQRELNGHQTSFGNKYKFKLNFDSMSNRLLILQFVY